MPARFNHCIELSVFILRTRHLSRYVGVNNSHSHLVFVSNSYVLTTWTLGKSCVLSLIEVMCILHTCKMVFFFFLCVVHVFYLSNNCDNGQERNLAFKIWCGHIVVFVSLWMQFSNISSSAGSAWTWYWE